MIEDNLSYQYWSDMVELKELTKLSYTSQLRKLEKYVKEEYNMDSVSIDFGAFYKDSKTGRTYPIDVKFVRRYSEWLTNRYTKSNAMTAFSAARCFFSFLHQHGKLPANPFSNVKFRVGKIIGRTTVLTDIESQELLDEAIRRDPVHMQFAVIVLLMLYGGLRNAEVRNLEWGHVNLEKRHIDLQKGTKRGKERTVVMSKVLFKVLSIYSLTKSDNKLLLFQKQGRAWTSVQLLTLIKDLVKAAGIEKSVTPHTLRHTCITNLYRSGVSPLVISQFAGHNHENTTYGYIHLSPSERQRVLDAQSSTRIIEKCMAYILD